MTVVMSIPEIGELGVLGQIARKCESHTFACSGANRTFACSKANRMPAKNSGGSRANRTPG